MLTHLPCCLSCRPQLYPPPADVERLTGEVSPAGFTALNGTSDPVGVVR